MKDLNFHNLYRITVFLVFSIALFHILIVGQNIIVPLVVAFFMAFLLLPFCRWLERKLRFPRALAAIGSLLLVLVGFAAVGLLFGNQIANFTSDLDTISERVRELKQRLPFELNESVFQSFEDGILPFLKENLAQIFSGVTSFIGSFTFAIVVPIYIVLILIYRNVFAGFLYRLFERVKDGAARSGETDDEAAIQNLLPRIQEIIQNYILGMFYVILILFVLNSAALLALGIEHALVFAAFAALLNIIPFVGPLFGAILPILFALVTKDSLIYPALVLVAFLVIQTAEGNLITPNIVGRNVSLNPLTTLVTLFIGAAVWGVVGMILFIPLVAVLKEILNHIPGLEPYAYLLGSGEEPQNQRKIWERIQKQLKK